MCHCQVVQGGRRQGLPLDLSPTNRKTLMKVLRFLFYYLLDLMNLIYKETLYNRYLTKNYTIHNYCNGNFQLFLFIYLYYII